MESVTVTEKNINPKITSGERIALVQDIKYPLFSSDDKEKNALCQKMNRFYSEIARKYSSYGKKKAEKIVGKAGDKSRPAVMAMKYTVTFCGECIVSVVLDLSFSKGDRIKMRRFSQMWSVKECCALSVGDVLNLSMENKKRICELVKKSVSAERKRGKKQYCDNFEIKAKKHFCFNNSFAAPTGMVFFFDAGVLREERYGACGFVVPYVSVKDMIKKDFSALLEDNKGNL